MAKIRVAMCQLNSVVGDMNGNAIRVINALKKAEAMGSEVAVFPELVLTGYPPKDLVFQDDVVSASQHALRRVSEATGECAAVVGFVDRDDLGRVFNAAAICHRGKIVGIYHKRELPNYGVFDEVRNFSVGKESFSLYQIAGVNVAICICEDVWFENGPVAMYAAEGAQLFLVPNASPFFYGRTTEREDILNQRIKECSVPFVYVNLVGGQDDLIFDGSSMVVDTTGVIVRSVRFEEAIQIVDLDVANSNVSSSTSNLIVLSATPRDFKAKINPSVENVGSFEELDEIYRALVLATRDYVWKNGFSDVVIGLSGGIDSALVATIAVDAFGCDHVHGVYLPSIYSSEESKTDAQKVARNLGINFTEMKISNVHDQLRKVILDAQEVIKGVTDENLQSRIRGTLLMALANNNQGWLVLSTSNKSEVAVGYSTIYGDMAGGFAPIKDVLKTLVVKLCSWRNQISSVIPESVLIKPPSAELRPDQRDDQSLPPYSELDAIIEAHMKGMGIKAIVDKTGSEQGLVERVVDMIRAAQFKREQGPPGPRVTSMSFSSYGDYRVPITIFGRPSNRESTRNT